MGITVGLDIGGSTTKIVGMKEHKVIYKEIIKADDPVTSAYGALGKLINDNSLSVKDIDRVNITGVGAAFPDGDLLGIKTVIITEFLSTGLGGLYISGLDRAVVVSMGTGTAYLDASYDHVRHIIGSGVGGGTIVGLCNAMVGIEDPEKLSDVAFDADIRKVDLTIGDISKAEIPGLPMDVTASNFGKAEDDLSKQEKIAGVFNLVYQSIGTMAVLSSRNCGCKDVVFTGQLTTLKQCRMYLSLFGNLYDVNIIIPENAEYATAIGACLAGDENER
ncbi:MAG: pantothenate kinase [Clostridiales bacterium]|nr:pantothenate kinase [Clostridiales bacterium]